MVQLLSPILISDRALRTNGVRRQADARVGGLLVPVDGVGQDGDERERNEEEPAELPVETAGVTDHELDVADEPAHPVNPADGQHLEDGEDEDDEAAAVVVDQGKYELVRRNSTLCARVSELAKANALKLNKIKVSELDQS
jgi:hypothetical protein